ncbi:MAG: hypothetical protein JW973_09100 [Bacteroidales bacterium]|nr:hypothetical protein [Bacteroidales bacterium]
MRYESWESFKTALDINSFFELPEIIGCPDCADGGAEWVEVELAGSRKHKVTFEYRNESEWLKDYVPGLRGMLRLAEHYGEF